MLRLLRLRLRSNGTSDVGGDHCDVVRGRALYVVAAQSQLADRVEGRHPVDLLTNQRRISMKYILLALFALLIGCDAGTGTGPVHNPWHESMSWFVRVADQRYWKNPRIAEEDTFATYPDPNAIRSAHSSYVWIEYYLLCGTSIIKHYKAVTFDFDIPDSFEWKNPTTGAKGVWRAGDSIYITLPWIS